MKIDRNGKASLITQNQFARLMRASKSEKFKLLLSLGIYTGERWGAICQLKIEDCYQSIRPNRTREFIIYKKKTRKNSAGKGTETREVPIHPDLALRLQAYILPCDACLDDWLFPSPVNSDRPITYRAAEDHLKRALAAGGLLNLGISTHSTRRTFITNLYRSGVGLQELQQITGHKSIKSLMEYVQTDPIRIKNAVCNFSL